jgi:energy-converting hydrogenase Eha subunit H
MRNWLAGIIAFAGLVFFFFVERNLLGFIVLIICAVAAAILFSEPEMDERIKKIREERQERRRKREKLSSQR